MEFPNLDDYDDLELSDDDLELSDDEFNSGKFCFETIIIKSEDKNLNLTRQKLVINLIHSVAIDAGGLSRHFFFEYRHLH